jgi:hypothetical protein
MTEDRHPGITMHKLSFGGGFIGLLFAAGSVLIFVLGFPTLWYFVALAFALGIAVAFLLRAIHDRKPQSNAPLSILAAADGDAPSPFTGRKRTLYQIFPRLASA